MSRTSVYGMIENGGEATMGARRPWRERSRSNPRAAALRAVVEQLLALGKSGRKLQQSNLERAVAATSYLGENSNGATWRKAVPYMVSLRSSLEEEKKVYFECVNSTERRRHGALKFSCINGLIIIIIIIINGL
jgi:hypothetical protein